MVELAHVATGGLIAYKISNPFISLPLALFSHFLVDLLPHWNPQLHSEKKKYGKISKKSLFLVITDCGIGLYLGLFLAFKVLPDYRRAIFVILGCLLGILPDLVEAPYYFFGKKGKFFNYIVKLQNLIHWKVSFTYGIIFQLLYLLSLIYLI